MIIRHRVPTVFTLYMVDVLCCALGCVIFLWFLKLHEAHKRERAAAQTNSLLAEARGRLSDTDLALADTRHRLRLTETDRELARKRLADLDRTLAEALARATATAARLSAEEARGRSLETDIAAARRRLGGLEQSLRQKESARAAAAQGADDLASRLRDTEARLELLRPEAEQAPGLREEVRISRERLAELQRRSDLLNREATDRKKELAGAGKTVQDLEEANRRLTRELDDRKRDSADAGRAIDTLRSEKRQLADQAARARAASENRFAGIALTGRRVVFLVDMSGSMDLVDEKTLAPEKWTGVRETLGRIMRSLPHLEKFQVIVFSDQADYLLGNENGWLDYDAKTSPDHALRALAATRPKGNTNMYAALEGAFRFRPAGLDTIYLLSDGLPNIGQGLSPEDARNMKETDRSEVLSKQIRRTLASEWNRPLPDRPRVRINAVGFFYESPDVGAFLWALARENDGSFVGMSKP